MLDNLFTSSQIEVTRDIVVVHHEEGPMVSRSALKAKILAGLAQSGGSRATPEDLVRVLAEFLEDNGIAVL